MLPKDYELEDYRIQDVLGVGGFGITYVATDETLLERVAIKEFMPAGVASHVGDTVLPVTGSKKTSYERLLQDFLSESRNIARIRHPNVVRVRRCFKRNGTAYMVMDYEEGQEFQTWLQDLGRLPTEAEVLKILLPLLDGLQKVHAVGLVHRDIKPQNIFIRTGDGSPVLLDFGAARHEDASHFTAILTAGYAPIEQYEEEARQGPWTDIYGMAAVLYRAVTGTKPQAALNRMAMDRLVPVSEAARGAYSETLLRGIDRGLAMAAEDRPRSVAEWRAGWLDLPEPAPVAVAPAAAAPPARHKPAAPKAIAEDVVEDTTVRLSGASPKVVPAPRPAPKPVPPPPAAEPEPSPVPVAAYPSPGTVPPPRPATGSSRIADDDEDEVCEEAPAAVPVDALLAASAAPLSWARVPADPRTGGARIVEVPATAADDEEDGPRSFDLIRPSWSMLALLAFFGFIEMAVATIILKRVFHGDGFAALPVAFLVTFVLSLGFARASKEVNWYSSAVWGGAAALGAAIVMVVLFGRFVF